MGARKLYKVDLLLSEEEARALIEAAGRRGQSAGQMLAQIAADIYDGRGDEGDMMAAYMDRSEPLDACRSFVSYCLNYGHDPGYLAGLDEAVKDRAAEVAEMAADLARGTFPQDNGWLPDTTPEDAAEELEWHRQALEDASKEKAELWAGYLDQAKEWDPMTEAEALAEAEAYQRSADAFLSGATDA